MSISLSARFRHVERYLGLPTFASYNHCQVRKGGKANDAHKGG
jgi:hypothetical protein